MICEGCFKTFFQSPSLIINILQHPDVYIFKLTLPVHKWHLDSGEKDGTFQTPQPLPILLPSLIPFSFYPH